MDQSISQLRISMESYINELRVELARYNKEVAEYEYFFAQVEYGDSNDDISIDAETEYSYFKAKVETIKQVIERLENIKNNKL